jgi:MFS family permease
VRKPSSWQDISSALSSCANVLMAAVAMVATLPGRTHGLGLITEPLLEDLRLSRSDYAQINLWATLLGALACVPAGRLIDRCGTRISAVVITGALGVTVLAMSAATSAGELFLAVLMTRALGQSALSVVSISIVGKWFTRRTGAAMSVYSILIGLLFAVAFGLVGWGVRGWGWREAWSGIGITLLAVCTPLFALLVRTPDVGATERDQVVDRSTEGFRLTDALRTPAFWIFGGATSLYGLAASGLGLFSQAILEERGFNAETHHQLLVVSTLVGMVSQLACCVLATKWPLHRLLALAMIVYAGSLLLLPHAQTLAALNIYLAMMGSAGGVVTVVFFAIWGQTFGRAHLGRIQGAAQMLTVFSSALGPLVFAEWAERTGSYTPLFYSLAPLVLCFGLAAACTPLPVKKVGSKLVEVAVAP